MQVGSARRNEIDGLAGFCPGEHKTMRKQESEEGQIDDHEQQTEPMSRVFLSPNASDIHKGVPAPQLDERPFPRQSAGPIGSFNRAPGIPPAYPVLPSAPVERSEEHTSELQSHLNLVCRLLLEKKKTVRFAAVPYNDSYMCER